MQSRHTPIDTTIQAGVAGTVVVINAVLNRETRESLSLAEKSLLNDSFMYTGGGLALTAIAARSLFKSGVAFRIMSANPCMCSLSFKSLQMAHSEQGWFLVSVSWAVSAR